MGHMKVTQSIKTYQFMALTCVSLSLSTSMSSIAMPFNGCTFYKSRLISDSFENGKAAAGCANFSAKLGRNHCKKKKCIGFACIKYKGDHIQMWLPDYFIEVTKHIGRSAFAESLDGKILELQLNLAQKWWESSTLGIANSFLSNGSQFDSARETFWHARILTIPYGSFANNFPPLAVAKGNGLPSCFSAITEFMPAQWNYNLSDAPYALALAPVGVSVCLSGIGSSVSGALAEAKSNIQGIAGLVGNLPSNPLQCANPVGAQEGLIKNALPTSDVFSPITSGNITKLCMGSWGNLIPRTGWIESEDPYMSALMAAYKFMSLAGDFHLNPDIKLKSDDKWQIVYPPRSKNKCFTAGSPFQDLPPPAEDSVTRFKDELATNSSLKNQTYIIAVWRRRESCEEPLQYINGWNATHKANFYKNKAICHAVSGE